MTFCKHNSRTTGQMSWLRLLTMCCLSSGMVWANTDYYRHTIFDNSLTSDTYFYSAGTSNGPSFLEQKDSRLPVDTKTFLTPPNALRIQWESQPGGGWEAEVRLINFRNRFPEMSGHNLYFWCFAPQAIAAPSPRSACNPSSAAKTGAMSGTGGCRFDRRGSSTKRVIGHLA